jgi:hypothetical protein
MPKFDRIPSEPDQRDLRFSVAPLIAQVEEIKTKIHAGPYVRLDQGEEGACVGFGITNDLMGSPVRVRPPDYKGDLRGQKLTAGNAFAQKVFEMARRDFDPWPGEDYDGTSVRAGFQAAQFLKAIEEYRWIRTPEEFRAALQKTPVIIGVNMYANMARPDANGFVRAGGSLLGGHCMCTNGIYVSKSRTYYRIRQSWGEHHGIRGDIFISDEDLMGVVFEDDGEAAVLLGEKLVA